MEFFTKNLKYLIDQEAIKVRYLEKKLKFSEGKISNVYRGTSSFKIEELIAIAEHFKRPLEFLIKQDVEEMERLKAQNKESALEEPLVYYGIIKVTDLYEIDIKTLPPRVQFYVNQLRTQIYQTYKRLEDKNETIAAKNETIKSLNKVIEAMEKAQ